MKRMTMLLCLIALVFVFVGSSSATQYTVTLENPVLNVNIDEDCQIQAHLEGVGYGNLWGASYYSLWPNQHTVAGLSIFQTNSVDTDPISLTDDVIQIKIGTGVNFWESGLYRVTVFYPSQD